MNWEAIDAISSILSAVAVIATLGYVAVQIRQNTSALRSAATQGAHDQFASMYDLLAGDPKLGDSFSRGMEAPDTLDRIETARLYAFLSAVMSRLQNTYLQTQAQALDEEVMERSYRVTRQISGMPGFKGFWKDRGHLFCSPALVKYLEQEVFLMEREPNFHPLGVRGEEQKQ